MNINLDLATKVLAAKQLKEWSQQFQYKTDHERVMIRVGDLKMFTKLCLGLFEFSDGGGSGQAITPLRLVVK